MSTSEYSRAFARDFRNLEGGTLLVGRDVFQKMVESWNRAGRVLDFGIGAGRSRDVLYQFGFQKVFGVDSGIEMLYKALEREPEKAVLNMHGNQLGFADNSFDYVSIQNVLQDIGNHSVLVSYMKEIARVLKQDGEVIMMNSTPESYATDMLNYKSAHYNNAASIKAGLGRPVLVDLTGVEETKSQDFVWRDRDFRAVFDQIGFEVLEYKTPLAKGKGWQAETTVPPWMYYRLRILKQP